MMYVMIYIRKSLEEKVKELAEREGKSPSTIFREWVVERLKEEEE